MSELIVIYTDQEARMIGLLERLGLRFVREKHGPGPVHHACAVDGFVLEVYPRPASFKRDRVKLFPEETQ